jgi:hypothetical protein
MILLRHSLIPTASHLDLVLIALRRLQNTTMGPSLLSLAESAATSTHVQPVGVDEAILLQARRIPLGAGDGVDVQHVHGVDLLERAALGLNHEEVDDEEEQDKRDGEDETIEVVNFVGDEGGAEGDDEVEEPVGRGGETHAGSAVSRRIQFTNDCPHQRPPGGCKCGNEQAGEDNHDVSGSGSVLGNDPVERKVTDKGVDEQAHGHPGSTDHHGLSAADILNDPETEDGGDDVDGSEDDGGDVRVGETGGGEDGCAVVEEVVGTCQLLTSLEDHTEQSTVQHAGASEDLVPWVIAASRLSLELLLDLSNLGVDERAVRLYAVQTGHVHASLVDLALAVCVTGRLGEEQDGAAEHDGPESRETVGNAPLCAVDVVLLCAVVDHVCGPDTECDEQLVRGDGGTTDALGDRLGLVHGDNSGESPDTETSSQAAHGKLNPDVFARDFDNHSSDVEEGGPGDCKTTTEGVSERS